jgi:Na+-transporting NADH:ubiquinone oxidoreductase subunit NqrF
MKRFEKEIAHFKFVPVVSQPEPDVAWSGATGRITNVAEDYLRKQNNAHELECYLCGSPGMIESSIGIMTKLGLPESKIYYDKFS